jgi:nucleoside-diphosphate-sugar epimerase
MNVLVIGGTSGFIGTQVIFKLVAAGHKVSVFHRGETKSELPSGVGEILGDRARLTDFADEFKALAPLVVIDNYLRFEDEARLLMETFRGLADQVVAISSQDVYRNFGLALRREETEPNNIPISEDGLLRSVLYPYRPMTSEEDPKYNYDKIPVENIVMSDPELPGTVLRLPATYGPGDKQHRIFEYLKRMDDGRKFILLGEAEARWRWTHGYVENVADAIMLAATDDRAKNRIYNVGEPEALTRKQWVEAIGRAAGWTGEIITVPTERLPDHLKSPVSFEHDIFVDTSCIRNELGYMEKVSREDGLKKTILWERANPPLESDPKNFDYQAEDEAARKHSIN